MFVLRTLVSADSFFAFPFLPASNPVSYCCLLNAGGKDESVWGSTVMIVHTVLTLCFCFFLLRLEPSASGPRKDLRFVLNHILAFLQFHLSLAKLSTSISPTIYRAADRQCTYMFLLLLLLQNVGDLLLETVQLLGPFANHFRRDLAVPHLVLAGRMLYGRLQHLPIGFSYEGDRSVKGSQLESFREVPKKVNVGVSDLPSFLSCSCRTPHTVQVLRKLARHVIVDDRLNPLDVQTTGGEVGSHEIVHVPIAELLERF